MKIKILFTIICFTFLLFFYGCDSATDNVSEHRITAKDRLEKVNDLLANSYYTSIPKRLLCIASDDVDQMGTSAKWTYIYDGIERNIRFYLYHAEFKKIAFDSISINRNLLPRCTNIIGKWQDSDQIIKVAEDNGGHEFRQRNTTRYGNAKYKIEAKLLSVEGKDFIKYWFVKYQSTVDSTDILSFDINAETGEAIMNYQ